MPEEFKIKRKPLRPGLGAKPQPITDVLGIAGKSAPPIEPTPLEKFGGREELGWAYQGMAFPTEQKPTTSRFTNLPLPERGVEVNLPSGERFNLSQEGHISASEGWMRDIPVARLNLETGTVEPTLVGKALPAAAKLLEPITKAISVTFASMGTPVAAALGRIKTTDMPSWISRTAIEQGKPPTMEEITAKTREPYEEYEKLDLWEQLLYETPGLIATGGGIAAATKPVLKTIAKVLGKGGVPAVEVLTSKVPANILKEAGIKTPFAEVSGGIAARNPEQLPQIGEIIVANYEKNVAAAIGSKVGKIPIVGKWLQGFNPMLSAKNAEERAVIAHMQLQDIAGSNAAIRMTPVWATKSPFTFEKAVSPTWRELRIKTGQLNVTNVTAKNPKYPLDINAIAEFPDRYYLSAAQRQELNFLDDLLVRQRMWEKMAGVKVVDIILKPGQRYFPRFVASVEGVANEVRQGIKKGVGAKQAFQRGRWYEEVRDGIIAGKTYGTDIRAAVESRLIAGNKAISDKFLADFLKRPNFKSFIAEAKQTPALGKQGTIQMAGLEGRIFPIDVAQNVNRMIEKEITSSEILRQLAKANAVARMGQTAIDTGYTLIQGLLLLSNNPAAWGKAFYTSMRTLIDPRYASRWAAGRQNTLLEMANRGAAPFMSSEFTEAARAGGILGRTPAVGRLFKRFGAAFEIYLDTSRTLLYESLAYKATTPIQKTALVNFVDNMVGIASSQRLGVSAVRRQWETNLLYAPRYFRAFVGLTADAFQGGMRGKLAREALIKFNIAIPTFMSAVALSLGQEERIIPTKEKPIPPMFDPRTGEFMTVEIAGTHMGLGGVWVAAWRLMGALVRTAQDSPEDFISIDPHENPGLRYWYGRSSPVAGAAIDIVTGSNYLGERLDTPMDYLNEVIDKTFPFWAAGQVTDVPKGGWQKGLAEWWGLRAWMVQYNEQARRMAEELIPNIPPDMIMPEQQEMIATGAKLTYDDLNNGQRAWLLEQYTEYREAQERAWEQRDKKGTDFEVFDAKIVEMLTDVYHADLRDYAEDVAVGEAEILDYIYQAEDLRRVRYGQFEYRGAYQLLADPKEWEKQQRWLEENRKPEDTAYEAYMELRGDLPKKAKLTEADWDAWEAKLDVYLAALPEGYTDYIETRRQQRFDNLPESAKKLEQVIDKCEQGLDPYYDVPSGSPRYDFRRANVELDAHLFVLGRVSQVMTYSATVVVNQLRQEAGLSEIEVKVADLPKTQTQEPGLVRRTIK